MKQREKISIYIFKLFNFQNRRFSHLLLYIDRILTYNKMFLAKSFPRIHLNVFRRYQQIYRGWGNDPKTNSTNLDFPNYIDYYFFIRCSSMMLTSSAFFSRNAPEWRSGTFFLD